MARKDDNDLRRHMDHSTRRQGSDRSPMHPQIRRTGSPAKVSSEGSQGFAPSTPGRSRLNTSRANSKQDDSSEKGPPLPKFGAWDATDPSSADGFTVIFNKARDEKRSGGTQRPQSPVGQDNGTYKGPDRSSSKKWYCCFGTPDDT